MAKMSISNLFMSRRVPKSLDQIEPKPMWRHGRTGLGKYFDRKVIYYIHNPIARAKLRFKHPYLRLVVAQAELSKKYKDNAMEKVESLLNPEPGTRINQFKVTSLINQAKKELSSDPENKLSRDSTG